MVFKPGKDYSQLEIRFLQSQGLLTEDWVFFLPFLSLRSQSSVRCSGDCFFMRIEYLKDDNTGPPA